MFVLSFFQSFFLLFCRFLGCFYFLNFFFFLFHFPTYTNSFKQHTLQVSEREKISFKYTQSASHEERHRVRELRKISFLKNCFDFFCRRRRRCFFVVGWLPLLGFFFFLFHATDTSHRCFLAPQSGFLSTLSIILKKSKELKERRT